MIKEKNKTPKLKKEENMKTERIITSILRRIQAYVPRCTYHVNIPLGGLSRAVEQYHIDMDPIYQRGYIWTQDQKKKFVGSVLENHRAIPSFWLNWIHKDYHRSHSEIVDGKQRINACLSWLNDDFAALCPCGEEVSYSDLGEVDLRGLSNGIVFDWNFVELNQKEVMRFYIRLNSGGTIYTNNDLDRVKTMILECK